MLGRLQVNAPDSYAGSDTTFDTLRNGIANYQYPNHAPEYLDYIFVSRNHRQLPFWHNQALDTPAPRWTVNLAGATWQFQDYSDHSPVAGFTRADSTTPTRASKPQQNLYGEVVLQSTTTGKTLSVGSSKANDWVKINGNGLEPESLFSLRNWYHPESFCIRSGDYIEVESRRHPGYWLNWWLGGGGGNYAYYMKAGSHSGAFAIWAAGIRRLRMGADDMHGLAIAIEFDVDEALVRQIVSATALAVDVLHALLDWPAADDGYTTVFRRGIRIGAQSGIPARAATSEQGV